MHKEMDSKRSSRHFCGMVLVKRDQNDSGNWAPVRLWKYRVSYHEMRERGLEIVFQKEFSLLDVDWTDISLVRVGEGIYEVYEVSTSKILAKGSFGLCMLYVGASRKKLVRESSHELTTRISSLLKTAREITTKASFEQCTNELESAYKSLILARQISLWIGGEYSKGICQEVREVRGLALKRILQNQAVEVQETQAPECAVVG